MSINAINISKRFGSFRALNNVSLKIPTGELVALLGPSGSGKTTLLRIIAGLERADDGGTVLFHDRDVTNFDAGERRIGFVFQHYALFRHMTVFQNVAFGLKVRPRRLRPSKAEIKDRVMELLEKVQLPQLAHRYPSQLSGGQRQRVALARALAVEPDVLLLDEPFGALDAGVRRDLRKWMRRLHDQIGVTSVFVTHDQEEAMELADHVAILNAGRIEQVGTPQEVYENPATPFVMRFLGNVNSFPGHKVKQVGEVAYARPHDIALQRESAGNHALAVKVKHVSVTGPVVRLSTVHDASSETIEVELTREEYKLLAPRHGDVLYAHARNTHVFPQAAGA